MMLRRVKVIAAIALLIAIGFAIRLLPIAEWLEQFKAYVQQLGAAGYVLYVVVYALCCVALIPASALTLGAGAIFGFVKGTLVVLAGATLGAAAAFLLGRTVLRKRVARMVAENPKLAAVDRAIAREGTRVMLLMRLSGFPPFTWINYALGLTGVSFRSYLLTTFFGMIPGVLAFTWAGTAGAAALAGTGNRVALIVTAAGAVIVSVYIARLATRAIRRDMLPPPTTAAEVFMSNPLAELTKTGQSIWFDQMERKLVSSGKLQAMIDEDDLRGLTSNPTIFEKAISGSEDYDTQLRQLAEQQKSSADIYDELVLEDIASAADVFRPVYDRTNGGDGFVSIEVSPLIAHDTNETIDEAKRLFARLGRPNVMVKIPATDAGIPAIEEATASGININITLIFSNEVYRQVIEAYLRGLERRVAANQPIGDIASVASFFVSRIDAQADKQLETKIAATTDPRTKAELQSLLGKVAIANAKMAYQLFKEVFSSDRFRKLRDKGARVQRPLWASTGTKNPSYSDVLYVETLIGADTVNTLPPATYNAFKDHGRVKVTIEENLDEAREVLRKFEAHGLSLDAITEQLTADGVKSFNQSFVSLAETIESRRDAAVYGLAERVTFHLGDHQAAVDAAVQRADKEKFVERIWKKDASLWKTDDASKKLISNALGWLRVTEEMQKDLGEITSFAESVRREFSHVVVLGMGGSSLCSEVLRRVYGKREGYPALLVLDSTVPEAVLNLEAKLDLERTLFIVASKSGTTTEPVMFHRYFYDRVKSATSRPGDHFVAVTDPGTQLSRDAERDSFRKIFLNPADIGGRYSALSKFGLVPAALAGVDVEKFVDHAVHAAHVSMSPSVRKNPAAHLGVVIGALATAGRDKLTLITPAPLDTLGLWIEQLVAESTGKEGKGILPIAAEPRLEAASYGKDRLFVAVRLRRSDETQYLRELTAAGHPVIDIVLEDALNLGETFFLWEFATAVAGAILGINPFDQPNVQESKDNTKRLLDEYKSRGSMGDGAKQAQPADGTVAKLLETVKAGDYVAFTEYFAETAARDKLIAAIREAVARELRVATTTGYGPRFLHSTGQLHKGSGDNGVFIQLTGGPREDVPIPNEPFGFGVLARAQAIGDFQSLVSRKRRATSVDLGEDVDAGLAKLHEAVKNALAKV